MKKKASNLSSSRWDVNHPFPAEIARRRTCKGAVGTSLSLHRICKAADTVNYFLSKVLSISNKHYNITPFLFTKGHDYIYSQINHVKNKAYVPQHNKSQNTKFRHSTFICIALRSFPTCAACPTVSCLSILKMALRRRNLKPIRFISLHFAHSAGLKVNSCIFHFYFQAQGA